MKEIKGIEKLKNIFGLDLSFHDANVLNVKYNNTNGSVTIDCKGYLKNRSLFQEDYKNLENIYVTFGFRNIGLFEFEYSNLDILELTIEEIDGNFIFKIDTDIKIISKEIEILEVKLIYKKEENNKYQDLDMLLKSNL